MTHALPDIVADPVGVMVDLVAAAEPALDRPVIEALVRTAAGGRAKQRKLACALAGRPQVLVDGRSPAPRAVGDLLIALRKAGAVAISPPVCAQCDKHLRSLQRRGEDWYCGVCGPAREACASCGTISLIHLRDRDGRPRCAKCPPEDVDPIQLIVECDRRHRAGSSDHCGRRRGHCRHSGGRTAPCPGLGRIRSPRPAHGSRGAGTGPGSAPTDRRAGRCRSDTHRQAAVPRLRPRDPPGQAPERGPALPELRRQVPRRDMFALWCRPRSRYP
jgi:hypothetical protein